MYQFNCLAEDNFSIMQIKFLSKFDDNFLQGGKHHNHYGKKGSHKKGGFHDLHKGHKKHYGHKGHHGHHKGYGHKSGHHGHHGHGFYWSYSQINAGLLVTSILMCDAILRFWHILKMF